MALVTKTNPIGADKVVDRLQKRLYDGLSWASYESYSLAYKNADNDQLLPEIYIGGNDYQSVLFNDNFNATSFFLMDDSIEISEGLSKVKLMIFFQVKLDKLYLNINHRATEECHNDVLKLLKNENVTSLKITPKEVYEEMFQIDMNSDDMHPFHVFRIDLNISYPTCCNC